MFTNFSSSNGSEYDHLIQIEYLKEKYREVLAQLKTTSSEKQRYEQLDMQNYTIRNLFLRIVQWDHKFLYNR